METIIIFLSFSVGILSLVLFILGMALSTVTKRITETNKQLLIVVAGKEKKPESALRALVASNRPPQGKLKGIADEKKKDTKPTNTDYQMTIGV